MAFVPAFGPSGQQGAATVVGSHGHTGPPSLLPSVYADVSGASGGCSGVLALGVFAAAAGVAGSGSRGAGRPTTRRQRQQRCRQGLGIALRASAAEKKALNTYVPIIVDRGEGGDPIQVEVKGTDTVALVKAVLQTQAGLAEESQELSFAGMVLEDDIAMMDCGIEEGSILNLTMLKSKDDEEEALSLEPEVSSIDGEPCVRLFLQSDVTVSKKKLFPIDVPLSESMAAVKLKAYEIAVKANKHLRRQPPKAYGLFIPDGPTVNEKGGLRHLTRKEKMDEKKTVQENGLEGGETMCFVNLFYYVYK